MTPRTTLSSFSRLAGGALLLLLALALLTGTAPARELAADADTFVEVEVEGLGLTPQGVPVILLRRPGGEKVIPVMVGDRQARAIARALRGTEPSRPRTHDLLRNTLQALDARLQRVYVDDVRGHTFYGMLRLAVPGREEPLLVDSRPSDAVALALRTGASIHVAPAVLATAQRVELEGMGDQIAKAGGITVNAVTEDLRRALELPDGKGVVVSAVTGPARQAGMRPGALIRRVNGRIPESPREFLEIMGETPSGAKALISYWQEGEAHEIRIPARSAQSREVRRRLPPHAGGTGR